MTAAAHPYLREDTVGAGAGALASVLIEQLSLKAAVAGGPSTGRELARQGTEQLTPALFLWRILKMFSPPTSPDILQHASPSPAQGTLGTEQAPGPSSAYHHLLSLPASLSCRPQWECLSHHFQAAVGPQTTNQEVGGGREEPPLQRLRKPLPKHLEKWVAGTGPASSPSWEPGLLSKLILE